MELTEKPDTFTVDGVAAWLRERVVIRGVDQKLVRVNVLTVTDMHAAVPEDASEEALDAFRRGAWWYMRCRVAVAMALMPTGKPARWLELGEAGIGKVVEGQQPGRPFVNVLEDGLSLWLELAQAAANEAEETLEALQGVTVAWTREALPVSGDAG